MCRSIALLLIISGVAGAQVHYHPDGSPWNRASLGGPDADVPGWFYNLGVTGLRVELMADAPKHLLVRHVLAGSPAAGRVQPGDVLVGAGGQPFETEHRNGYGMDVFGADGPVLEFAGALERSLSAEGRGRLALSVERGGKTGEIELRLPRRFLGSYGESFPADCPKSERILEQLLAYLLAEQRPDGSWGSPPQDTFAPLALLASGKKEHLAAVRRNVRWHAASTSSSDSSSLINWRYMSAAIVMSEYYLATREEWVLPELREVYQFLVSSQYVDRAQISERVKETHPHAYPEGELEAHGGWGHNTGFEGYGPICMITAQGALASALMSRCGVDVDRERLDAAYAFLARGTGKNGYVWYEDEVAGDDNWADMGRTGAAAIACFLGPDGDETLREQALAHARVIGAHPQSFPDTHGSPLMGMGYTAMGAAVDPVSFRKLMDANRWWFVLARCPDGTFYYQPNRDNAGYGADSRLAASAVTAFIYSIPRHNLHVTGKPLH